MDVLSDLLRAVRLTGAVYFDIRARAPWVAESPAAASVGERVMPEFEQVIFFHIVLDGALLGARSPTIRRRAIRLGPGEAVVVPGGDRHVMSSAPGMRAEPAMGLYRHPERQAAALRLHRLRRRRRADALCLRLSRLRPAVQPGARRAAAADARHRRRSRQPA